MLAALDELHDGAATEVVEVLREQVEAFRKMRLLGLLRSQRRPIGKTGVGKSRGGT